MAVKVVRRKTCSSAEGTRGGEPERGLSPFRKGGSGGSPPIKF